jgi:uncharacterized glyoxalase superfamily protein PhnB
MTESFRAQKLSVSLSCNDLLKSLAWYRDVVGFTEGERYERDGSLRAVVLGAGDMQILIGQDDGAKGMNRAKGQGMSFQFTTDQSVDDIANRIKANGGTLESDPIDTPWGARTFRLADPDGFTLVISSERSR